MADLSDVTAALVALSASALNLDQAGFSSSMGAKIRVFEGWPHPNTADKDMPAGVADVSVYPMHAGSSAGVFQILDAQYVVVAPVHGMAAIVADDAVTLSGAPTPGEFLSLILDGALVSSHTGSTPGDILAAILADIHAAYPSASLNYHTLTIPGAHRIEARIGAPATVSRVTHRQKQPIMVTIWAGNPRLRSAVAAAVDAHIKANLRIALPDGSQAIVRFMTTNNDDARINDGIYRRDLIYEVEYATLETYQTVEITTFNATIDAGPSMVGHVADDAISSEGTTL